MLARQKHDRRPHGKPVWLGLVYLLNNVFISMIHWNSANNNNAGDLPAEQQYGRGNAILSEIDSPTKDTPHRPTDDGHCSSHSTASIPLWTSDLTRLVVTLILLTIHYYPLNIICTSYIHYYLYIYIFEYFLA